MENIEITEKNITIYEELLKIKEELEPFQKLEVGLFGAMTSVISIYGAVIMKLLGDIPIIPGLICSGTIVPFLMYNGHEDIKSKRKRRMEEFKENHPEVDTTIETEKLKEKIQEYRNNLEEYVMDVKEQQEYNEDLYFTGEFEKLSREEKLEALKLEREKLMAATEPMELGKQKIYQKSDDLKGFHES